MRFAAKDHLGESAPLVRALGAAGHVLSADGPTDLFLTDLDCDKFGYRDLIDFYRECGAVVLQYPHGAPASTLQYDCLYEPYAAVDGHLSNGRGEIDYLRSIGVERPAQVMGWQLCHQFPFRPCPAPRRVVFAPTHVNADGGLDDDRVERNRSVFEDLLNGGWAELVVRYVGELENLGLRRDDRVFRYVQGDRDMTTVEIDAADCVVAGAGTYPCLAVARGVPTVMYDQFSGARYGLAEDVTQPLRNLEKYRNIVRYPVDVEDAPLTELICAVSGGDYALIARVRDWQRRWIGRSFDGPAFAKMIEAWVPELRAARAELSSVNYT